MTTALYKLGKFSARRPALVLLIWVLVLALGGMGALFMAKGATSNYTIPGASFQQISDQLKERLPSAGVSSGLITVSSEDGAAFTDAQKEAFSQTAHQVAGFSTVASVSNPFTAQAQLDEAGTQVADTPTQIADGQRKIDEGRAQLADGETKLNDAQKTIDDGRQQLETAKSQLPEGMTPEMLAATAPELVEQEKQLADAQNQLDGQRQHINDQRTQLDNAQKELDSQKTI